MADVTEFLASLQPAQLVILIVIVVLAVLSIVEPWFSLNRLQELSGIKEELRKIRELLQERGGGDG